jgi:hypothetical protein
LEDFGLWFSTGAAHIADLKGYDHILFVLSLCGSYRFRDWKPLLALVTAFTVGHSITLALSVLGKLPLNTAWVEFLIPVTIALTALWQLQQGDKKSHPKVGLLYVFTAVFGLIHGLGFSFLLRSMLGSQEQLFWPLLGFNLGLEAGQLLIVVVALVAAAIVGGLGIQAGKWRFFVNSAIFGIAFILLLERLPV